MGERCFAPNRHADCFDMCCAIEFALGGKVLVCPKLPQLRPQLWFTFIFLYENCNERLIKRGLMDKKKTRCKARTVKQELK